MDKKRIVIGGGVAVVLFALALFLVNRGEFPQGGDERERNGSPIPTREQVSVLPEVPELDSGDLPPHVARPTQVAAIGARSGNYLRKFTIAMRDNRFLPDTVIARKGDYVHVAFTAMDRDYDIAQPDLGFRSVIRKGETREARFTAAAPAKFTFYCEGCGGLARGPRGFIIIVP